MTYTPAKIVATAGQRDFTVPFPFISRSHVEVLVNGTQATVLEWTDGTTLRLASTLAGGESVILRRVTPIDDALVQFQNGAILTAEDLNLAVQQTLYKLQETAALYNGALSDAQVRLAQNLGIVTTPSAVADMLAIEVLGSEVLATFQQRIADIDLNAENIIQQALDLTDLGTQFTDEQAARAASEAQLVSSLGTVTTTIGTLQSDLSSLEAVVDGLATIDGEGIATVIANEEAQRIAGDTALASTLSLIGAKNGASTAFILNTGTVQVSPTETLAQRLSAITTKADGNEARIIAEESTRASADSALSSSLSALTARVGTAEAEIITQATARAAGDNALSQTIALLGAKNGVGDAFILNLNTARVSASETLGQRLTVLQSQYDNTLGLITSEQTVRANGDAALSASIASVAAQANANAAAITAEQVARADGDSAVAASVTSLASQVNANSAAITNEITTRANADTAFAQQFALLGAKNGGGTAWVLDQNTVQVGGGVTLGSRLSGIDASLASNSAAIVTEQTARASADSALSSQITTLTSTVNGNTASITSVQSTVNGLNAKYGVSLNVNGHITGFVQNNNGSSGDFTIVADVFRIIAPAGGSPVTPFSVTAEGVRINGNLIVNGSIINDQFNMATMVKKASLSWSGSQTPSPGSTVVISEVALGDIAKEGSLLIEYAVTASAYLGQAFSSFAGKPLTTTYLADGSVRLRVIDGANNVLSEVSLTGSQFGTSGAATYDVGGFGQKVVELTGGAKTGLKLQLVASRGNTDTGNVDEGDYYTRNISGTYTVTASTAKAKWTFI
jgi:hypothetical protein